MERGNMRHITTMHDGMTEHERLADRKDEEGRIDWSVMSDWSSMAEHEYNEVDEEKRARTEESEPPK
jgi:hypothetical protein